MPTPPDEQRCRATTKGMTVHGVYWSPPKRCSHWARENGYCWAHQPAEDGRPESPRRVDAEEDAQVKAGDRVRVVIPRN